jgi:hypothetical protein
MPNTMPASAPGCTEMTEATDPHMAEAAELAGLLCTIWRELAPDGSVTLTPQQVILATDAIREVVNARIWAVWMRDSTS